MEKNKVNDDFLKRLRNDIGGKSEDLDTKETNNRDKSNLNKKNLSHYEMMSAIATAIHQTSLHTDSHKQKDWEEDSGKSYWLEYKPTSALKFKFIDNKLVLMFTKEITNPLALDNHYKNQTDVALKDALDSVKKKYKEITGKTLSLTAETDVFEQVLPLSMTRQLRTYSCMYKIAGIESMSELAEKERKELLKSALDKADAMTVYKKKGKS